MKQEELENYIYTYGKELYSFCCCVTRNRQEADDLYQDTFLKMYEMADQLVIMTNPKSFLMGVALNLYRNYKRKLSIRQRITGVSISMDEIAESIPFEGLETEDMLISREECQIVRMAVAKLPDKYRIPILLYYMEEFSQAEIAAVMQISDSAVKTRIHRAKKILRERLEGLL
ncbi:MAG: RNA polymerase sigma factor [Lachnospiraceae bacterium]|nr:RNA polymerase sigma factor [Lachnospiraceae bacterium]